MSPLGERLRVLRQQAGMSQTDLAGSQLSPSYVSLIEAGKRQPSPEVMRFLSTQLNCRVEDFEAGPQSQERQYVDLEISYAKIALRNGEPGSARDRLLRVVEMDDLDDETLDDARYLLSKSMDGCNDPALAASVIYPLYERALAERSHFPITTVASALSWYYTAAGDLNAARRVGESGLLAAEEQGLIGTSEHFNLAVNMMNICYELGDFTQSMILAEQLLQLVDRAGSREQGLIYWHAALVAEAQGKLQQAVHLCERALAMMSEGPTNRDLPRLRVETAAIMLRADPTLVNQAVATLDRALADLEDLGSPADLALWECARAHAELFLGHSLQAEQLARQALLHSNKAPTFALARAHMMLGDSVAALQRRDEAVAHYNDASRVLTGCPASRQVAAVWREVADRLALAGDVANALQAYSHALDSGGIRSHLTAARVAFGIEPLPTPVRPVAVPVASPLQPTAEPAPISAFR